MSAEDHGGWTSRAKLIKHIRWDIRRTWLAVWAFEKPLPTGAELAVRYWQKTGDWTDPSRHKEKPHTPFEYKIEKSLHRDSADARRMAAECRRQGAEWRDRAVFLRRRIDDLESEIAELLRGEDWG